MNAWQEDLYRDQLATKAWGDLNAPDPCRSQLITAATSIKECVMFLARAESRLADGMTELFDTPMELRLGSFLDQLQDIRIDLNDLSKKYERGERE